MGNLKIKLRYRNFEIEFDGEEKTVKEQFSEVKKNGLGNILGSVDAVEEAVIITEQTGEIAQGRKELAEISETKYPALPNIVRKSLPKYESEWVLIYGFYASNFGNKEFTRDDIRELYKRSKRDKASNLNNLSNNINIVIGKEWFEQLNDVDFIVTEEGAKKANQIITGPKQSKPSKSLSAKTSVKDTKKSGSTTTKPETLSMVDLGLSKEDRTAMKKFYNEKEPKGQNDQVLVLAYWLKENKNKDKFDPNDVFTALRTVDVAVPKFLSQVLRNIKNNHKMIKNGDGTYSLHHIGEDYVNLQLPKNKEK